jgi:EmrB/QacA subfamily drug resistance transporter
MFAAGSAACGLAQSIDELIGFRILQGIGGGTLLPAAQIILVRRAGPANLGRAMSAMGIPLLMAPVFGPTIGGVLLEVSWRLIFYINIPVGIAAVICSLKLLDADPPERVPRPDLLGLVLGAGGMVGLTYGLAQIGPHPFASAYVLAPLAAGVTLIGLFCLRALHVTHPLLDVRLYANTGFRAAAIAYFCGAAVFFGSLILLPLYFQGLRGLSPFDTGLLLFPQGFGAAIGTFTYGRFSHRVSSGVTSAIGGAIACAATVPFTLIGAHTPYALLEIFMLVRGFGLGMTTMPIMTAAYRALGPKAVNDAAPQLNVLQRLGASIGVAVLAVTLQRGLAHAGASRARQATAFDHTFILVAVAAAAILPPVLVLIRAERAAPTLDDEGPATLLTEA